MERAALGGEMMLSHDEILAVLEEMAPRAGAEPGDEPRFEIRAGDTCQGLGVCLEPTERNLYLAAGDGTNFLITHHAWQGEADAVIRAKGISIYRLHSNWDLAPDGNLATLARMLGLRDLLLAEGALTGTVDLSFAELLARCQQVIGQATLPYCGDLERYVAAVGIIPGAGFMPIFRGRWEALRAVGCDTIISGEISHAAARFAQRAGVRLIDLGHNGLVRPGMAHLAYLLRCRLAVYGCPVELYEDVYAASYYAAQNPSPPAEDRDASAGGPGGIVLPFSR